MPENPVVERVRSLVQAFLETDLVRLRIERDGGHVELRRRASARTAAPQIAEPAAAVSAPADGQREVAVYLSENPHANGMLIGYVADARLGFVTDLWSPGAAPLPDKITRARSQGSNP